MARSDHARELRRTLSDPLRVIEILALGKGAQRQAGGATVCCPHHRERTPSCSVTRGPDGTVRARCFGCDWSGDVLGLIAEVNGLDTRAQFQEVLALAAELAGRWDIVEEIRGVAVPPEQRTREPIAPPVELEPPPPREYPPEHEVIAIWRGACSVGDDPEATAYLAGRAIDARKLDDLGIARVIDAAQPLPAWARYQGRTWAETGHRVIVRAFDAHGTMRSVRAWRITEGASPKRLPPAGHRATGLVMANRPAWELLAGRGVPERVIVQEGEPDFCVAATAWPDAAVLGIVSGSWTREMAERIAAVRSVVIRTHMDAAGDKYADAIRKSLEGRCEIWRVAS